MKKLMLSALCAIMVILFCGTACAQATTLIPLDVDSTYIPDAPSVSSKRAIVVDNTTGTILYSKGSLTTKLYPASTTKILTALLVMESVEDLDNTTVTVSAKACNLSDGASVMGLQPGDKLSVTDLMYGLLLRSGNDAAIALAEYVSGNVNDFVKLMNKKAKQLGATNTNFVNPHGMHNADHYTSLNDMSLFAMALTKNETLNKMVSTTEYTAHIKRSSKNIDLVLKSTNKFLDKTTEEYNKYITGMKTGSTSEAGCCLVTRYQKQNTDLLVLSFGGSADTYLGDTAKLIDYAESSFTTISLSELFASRDFVVQVSNASVSDQNNGQLSLRFSNVPDLNFVTTIPIANALKNATDPVRVVLPENIQAPIYVGDVVGAAQIYLGDEVLLDSDVSAMRTVLDHMEVPKDLVPLALTAKAGEDSLFANTYFLLALLLSPIVLFLIFFFIKLIIYNKKQQRSGKRSNVYARRHSGSY